MIADILRINIYTTMFGAQGGNRTRTTFGQGILSPSRLPIPPLAPIFCTNDRPMSMFTDV